MPTQPYPLKDGTMAPGVTTILGSTLGWGNDQLLNWAVGLARSGQDHAAVRDRAARVGTITHARIEAALSGEVLDLSPYDALEVKDSDDPVRCFREWRDSRNPEDLYRELALVSEVHRFGGTLDWICRLQGEKALVDFKTSRTLRPSHILQAAGYKILAEENGYGPIERLVLLHVPKGGKKARAFRVRPEAVPKAEEAFKAILGLYKARPALTLTAACEKGE